MVARTRRTSRRSSAVVDACESLENRLLFCAPGLEEWNVIAPKLPDGFVLSAKNNPTVGRRPTTSGPDAGTADIVWTNRGLASDGFATVFGAGAATARLVVDQVIADFEAVITSFNRSSGTTALSLTISMDGGTGNGGGAGSYVYDAQGKPISGAISMATGGDGHGSGWFIDPTPADQSEFAGTIQGPYCADAQGGSAASGKGDFYTVLASEITHTLGISSNVDSLYFNSGFITNTGVADNAEGGGVGTFWIFDGPSINHLMTSNNGGAGGSNRPSPLHGAGGNATPRTFSGVVYYTAQDCMNAVYEFGRRYMFGRTSARIMKDGLGYTIDETHLKSFYTPYISGQINGRGGATTSADDYVISRTGTEMFFSADIGTEVPGTNENAGTGNAAPFVSAYTTSTISSIDFDSGDGTDSYVINYIGASMPSAFDGNAGTDTFTIGGGDFDTNINSTVSIVGNAGTDSLTVNDTTDGSGADGYTLTSTQFNKPLIGVATTYSTLESLVVNGSPNSEPVTISSLNTPLVWNAGDGDDAFTIGGGDYDTNFNAALTINGQVGTDSVIIDDTTDGLGSDLYTFSSTQFNKPTIGLALTYGTLEAFTVNGSPSSDTVTISSASSLTPLIWNGGDGDDSFTVGGGDYDTNIGSALTINGNAGTDTVTIDDTTDGLGSDSYTFTTTQFDKPIIGQPLTYATIEGFTVNGSPQSDVIAITGLLTATPLIWNCGAGNDSVTAGGGDYDTNFSGNAASTLTINGDAGTDSVVIDDTADGSGADTYTFSSFQFSKPFDVDVLNYSAIESFTVNGSPQSDVIDISGTLGSTPLLWNAGDGADTINVGTGNLDLLPGAVTVNGGNGVDALNVNDNAVGFGDTYTVTSTTVTRVAFGGLTYGTCESFALNAQTSANTINVNSMAIPAVIDGTNGTDLINVGPGVAPGVQGITAQLTLTNTAGLNNIFVDDSGDGVARVVTMDVAAGFETVTGLAPGQIRWSVARTLNTTVRTGSAVDTVNLLRNSNTLAITTAGGADTVNIGTLAAPGVQGILMNVSISNPPSFTTINVNDSGDAVARAITIDTAVGTTTISGLCPGTISYATTDTNAVNLTTGLGADNLTVLRISNTLSLSTQNGGDSILIGNGVNGTQSILANISIANPPSFSSVTIDDSADTTGRAVVMNDGSITGIAPAPVSISWVSNDVTQVKVLCGTGADTVTVNGTTAIAFTQLNAGPGTDTVTVNNTNATSPLYLNPSTGGDTVNVNTDNTSTAKLIFNGGQTIGALTIGAGGTAMMAPAAGAQVLRMSGLTTNATGKLDIVDDVVILDYAGASPLTTVRTMIATGYNGGDWAGNRVTSSTAQANAAATTAIGYAEARDILGIAPTGSGAFAGSVVDGTTLLIKYTWYGDSDLSGDVDQSADLTLYIIGFNTAGSTWYEGDYDYNFSVDQTGDLTLYIIGLNSQTGTLGGGDAGISGGEDDISAGDAILFA